MPKFTPKDLKIIKAIKGNNKSALERIKKAKEAQKAIKIMEEYMLTHGKIPRA